MHTDYYCFKIYDTEDLPMFVFVCTLHYN